MRSGGSAWTILLPDVSSGSAASAGQPASSMKWPRDAPVQGRGDPSVQHFWVASASPPLSLGLPKKMAHLVVARSAIPARHMAACLRAGMGCKPTRNREFPAALVRSNYKPGRVGHSIGRPSHRILVLAHLPCRGAFATGDSISPHTFGDTAAFHLLPLSSNLEGVARVPRRHHVISLSPPLVMPLLRSPHARPYGGCPFLAASGPGLLMVSFGILPRSCEGVHSSPASVLTRRDSINAHLMGNGVTHAHTSFLLSRGRPQPDTKYTPDLDPSLFRVRALRGRAVGFTHGSQSFSIFRCEIGPAG